ncbi:MAG: dihydrodipicolinate synthase family protein [Anaerolineae bacterium]|nr:dihydrodipicolinate synthase family protein [Anaerolineae bacterium]
MQPVVMPDGVWPAMITPLMADRSIDWRGVDALTDWLIEAGVAGLFAVGQSGEMFKLSDEERLALARRVVERTAGRVPVVASGTFGGPIDRQANFIRQMAATGVQAVTVIISELADPEEGDDIWQERAEQLLALTGDQPLALYECPEPYHRTISPRLVNWAANTGRFLLLKETSRSLQSVKEKVAASEGTPLHVFNADATALLESLKAGARGYCGIAANFYPDLVAWLCAHYADHPEEAAQLQALFSTADPVLHLKYPVCAKYFRQKAGFDMRLDSRVSEARLDDYDRRVLDAVAVTVDHFRSALFAH